MENIHHIYFSSTSELQQYEFMAQLSVTTSEAGAEPLSDSTDVTGLCRTVYCA